MYNRSNTHICSTYHFNFNEKTKIYSNKQEVIGSEHSNLIRKITGFKNFSKLKNPNYFSNLRLSQTTNKNQFIKVTSLNNNQFKKPFSNETKIIQSSKTDALSNKQKTGNNISSLNDKEIQTFTSKGLRWSLVVKQGVGEKKENSQIQTTTKIFLNKIYKKTPTDLKTINNTTVLSNQSLSELKKNTLKNKVSGLKYLSTNLLASQYAFVPAGNNIDFKIINAKYNYNKSYSIFPLSLTKDPDTNLSINDYTSFKQVHQSPKQILNKFDNAYSKQTEINLITISLASANRIRQWAEKTLPNGKVVGEVTNPETVHYKTLKPIKGGLFCERIFGPLKDHECACGKKFNIKNYLTKGNTNVSFLNPDEQAKLQKRYFCRICDVEYTYSIIRRTQLGYIQLASPTTHVWFVKGIPSYISILLDMKKKHLQNIIYNSETLTLEHSLRGRQFLPSSPSSIFESWQKIMQRQYPEKYGKQPTNELENQSKTNLAKLQTKQNTFKNLIVSQEINKTIPKLQNQDNLLLPDFKEQLKKYKFENYTYKQQKVLFQQNKKAYYSKSNLKTHLPVSIYKNATKTKNLNNTLKNYNYTNIINQKNHKLETYDLNLTFSLIGLDKKQFISQKSGTQQKLRSKKQRINFKNQKLFQDLKSDFIKNKRFLIQNKNKGWFKLVNMLSENQKNLYLNFLNKDFLKTTNEFLIKKVRQKRDRFPNQIYISKQRDLQFLFVLLLKKGQIEFSKQSLMKLSPILPISIKNFLTLFCNSTVFSSKNTAEFYKNKLVTIPKGLRRRLVVKQGVQSKKSPIPLYFLFKKTSLSVLKDIRTSIFKDEILSTNKTSDFNKTFITLFEELKQNFALIFKTPILFSSEILNSSLNKVWNFYTKSINITEFDSFKKLYSSNNIDRVKESMHNKNVFFINNTIFKKHILTKFLNLKTTSIKNYAFEQYINFLLSGLSKTNINFFKQTNTLYLLAKSFKTCNLEYFEKQTTKLALMLLLNLKNTSKTFLTKNKDKMINYFKSLKDHQTTNILAKSKTFNNSETNSLFAFSKSNHKKRYLICKLEMFNTIQPTFIFKSRNLTYVNMKALILYYFFLNLNKKELVIKLYNSLLAEFDIILKNLYGSHIIEERISNFEKQTKDSPGDFLLNKDKISFKKDNLKLNYLQKMFALKTFTCVLNIPVIYKLENLVLNNLLNKESLSKDKDLKNEQSVILNRIKNSNFKTLFHEICSSSNLAKNSVLKKPDFISKNIKFWNPIANTRFWNNKIVSNIKARNHLDFKDISQKPVSDRNTFISNNIYCLSHRQLWEQEKDWQDFAYYYYSPSNLTDFAIPAYKNRNYDLLFNVDNTLTGTTQIPTQNILFNSGMNINTSFSGAGLIQKLLNEFNYTELKKMDKQNRILLFEYNKNIKNLKKIMTSSLIKNRLIKSKVEYYKACHIRDVLIRRTKLTRKIVNKLVPTSNAIAASQALHQDMNGLNLILTLLPVLPPVLRPVLKMAGQFTISDLNRLYQRIIYRNERLKKFLKDPALSSSFEMKYAQRLVQEAVDNLIQNGKSGVVPEKDARGRLLKSLSDILKGKQGRFRQYLLGKRVDYSGRSVIVVGPGLKLHQCGIPKEMALVLYSPFLIKRILNEKLADTYLSAKKLIQKNPLLVSQLLREIMKTCPVLLNRAPTLHRLGFQAFQPKLVDGKAILLHPLVCPAFNADFDGDQMAVHVPITFEARAEAWKLMLARNNLLSPATGEPLILPSQDMVLGCYYLTTNCAEKWSKFKKGSGMYFHTINDVLKAYSLKLIHLHAVIWVNIKAPIENGNYVEQPLEIRFPLTTYKINKQTQIIKSQNFNNLPCFIEIYSKTHNSVTIEGDIISKIIKTTPGKILFNTIIKKSIEKRPTLLSKYSSQTGYVKNKIINTIKLETENFFKRETSLLSERTNSML